MLYEEKRTWRCNNPEALLRTFIAAELFSTQAGREVNTIVKLYEQQIEEVLDICFPGISKAEISKTLFVDGHSSDTLFLLKHREQHCVLKLFDPSTPSFQIEMKVHMMQQVDQAGVGPHIICFSKDKKAIVQEYIPGGTLTLEQSKNPENLFQIAETMRRLHRTEKNPYIQESLLERITKAYHLCYDYVENKEDMKKALAFLQKATKIQMGLNFEKVNIHCDLVPRNIFVSNERAVFIDEYLFFEDPFLDIACFTLSMGFEDQEGIEFLETYLRRSSLPEERKRFLLAKIIAAARLCMACNRYASILHIQWGAVIDPLLPVQNYLFYADQLSSQNNPLPAQFFYDIAKAFLIKAEQFAKIAFESESNGCDSLSQLLKRAPTKTKTIA